jgi:fibronectin type 3 domain-containing protein
MKLWKLATLCTVSLAIFSGCSTTSPKPKDEVVVDSTLPVIELTKNGVFVDMNAVAFEWKNITDGRVKGIYIYKKTIGKKDIKEGEEGSKDEYYDTLNSRFTTHYVDKQITPDTQYSYYFKTFSDTAESNPSKIITLNSLPVLQSVSWIHSIEGMPRSAKIIWRPHPNQKVKAYIIERKTLQGEEWQKLATIEGRLNAEYIDKGLKDNFVYKYRIRVVTFDNIISTPSEIVRVVTKALPNSVTGIVATKNLPKVIKLNWDKSENKDFYRYYVYRADEIDGTYELIAKLHNNRFTDEIDEDGKNYFYRVSIVDEDGLESEHEKVSIHGMTLTKPNAPAVVEAKLVGSKIELFWSQVDPRTKNYTVIKKSKQGWFDTVTSEITDIPNTSYTDTKITPNTTYFYQIYAVDENGIKSEPSIEIKIQTKELSVNNVSSKTSKADETTVAPAEDATKNTQETIIPVEDFN